MRGCKLFVQDSSVPPLCRERPLCNMMIFLEPRIPEIPRRAKQWVPEVGLGPQCAGFESSNSKPHAPCFSKRCEDLRAFLAKRLAGTAGEEAGLQRDLTRIQLLRGSPLGFTPEFARFGIPSYLCHGALSLQHEFHSAHPPCKVPNNYAC